MEKNISAVWPPVFGIQKIGKYLLPSVILLALAISANAQQKYVINGKINGLTKDMKVLFSYSPSKEVFIRDSAVVKNGAFHLEGTIARPYKVNLYLRSFNPPPPHNYKVGDIVPATDGQSFYLTPGTTTITGNNLNSAVVDNPVQAEYMAYENSLMPLKKAAGPTNLALYHAKNPDSIAVLKQKQAAFTKQFERISIDFIKAHPSSYVAYDIVKSHAVVIQDPESFELMFHALAPKFKNSEEGKKMLHDLAMVKKFAIGQPIMNFTQADVNGKPFSLSSLKGKYVLVDFWASWCGPCRMEYPYIHKAYDQFKNKNFEVIGVSLDDKKDLWINAIQDNHFDWVEVCDLKGRKNEVAVAYGISAIPQSLLVDPNGIIIAKNLRGEDLVEKLNEVIK
ncbi:TlpA disulfide reductase family protein [Mucilaginibacter paludis]|uniref:Alkyl hydroperoxide reductase/ Thiol specific antioxidant/ Mal allergen n=1 Tax=Mucilaginibacter paludis DSM 18603 TaxID=714943 RepID=H1YA59_9SPHI|nr:TlpA disulfide reductase family protein [Mucilaginibacter paludis]EHQ25940.1 alkyl hydroperoxide reductase/ Thiol specific antioxidant/ Mal allergen [Mucilaginibacter paludis DSM 18603]